MFEAVAQNLVFGILVGRLVWIGCCGHRHGIRGHKIP
jgi:hypothetical protein